MAEGGEGASKYDRQDTEDLTDLPLRVPVSTSRVLETLSIPIKAHHHKRMLVLFVAGCRPI